jgi:N-acetylglucosaminyldiphosphoundecaprenol N-acetyl-beta-D-mannosaminyltransferase
MTPAGTRPQARCLGHLFDAISLEDAAETCIGWARQGASPRIVFPVNAAIVVAMRRDVELRLACDAADLRIADGKPILWAARLVGEELPERVTGIDLMERLVRSAAEESLSVFFLGAKPAVVEAVVRRYRERYPKLVIAGYHHGYFDQAETRALRDLIRECAPAILFIGMPTPFKEVWAERYRDELGVPVILGVGGSFDVIAGVIRRAPGWMQRAGLEWLWRLLCEPRRLWRRYVIGNAQFLLIMLASTLRNRFPPRR